MNAGDVARFNSHSGVRDCSWPFMAAARKPLCENFVITNCLQRIGCNEKGLPLGEALSALITALSHFSARRGDPRY
jgi:hypothetical protein